MRFFFLSLSLCLCLIVACGDNAPATDGGARDAATADTAAMDTAAADSIGMTDAGVDLDSIDKTPDPSCTATWMVGGRGTALLDNGEPAVAARVQMCLRVEPDSRLLCLVPQGVDAEGRYAIVFPESARCVSGLTYRTFVPSEAVATTYCVSDLAVTDAILEREAPLVLRRTTPATDLPPEGVATEVRTVTLAPGFELALSPSQLEGSYGRLGLAVITEPSCTTENAPEFVSTYAFSPEMSLFTGSIGLRLPNPSGLSAGTSVDLLVVGGLSTRTLDDEEIPEGVWAPVGVGIVSEDGASIAGDMASTTALTWLGVRVPKR